MAKAIKNNLEEDPILTVSDVQKHMHIGNNKAYDLFKNDKSFPSFKIGGRYYVLQSQYLEWIQKMGNKNKYLLR